MADTGYIITRFFVSTCALITGGTYEEAGNTKNEKLEFTKRTEDDQMSVLEMLICTVENLMERRVALVQSSQRFEKTLSMKSRPLF